MQGAVQLFGMEYLTLGLVVSLFLLLGLSALGPVMIFGSMMLYGLGSGLLMVQLCTADGWKTVLLALLWTGLPAAAASGKVLPPAPEQTATRFIGLSVSV